RRAVAEADGGGAAPTSRELCAKRPSRAPQEGGFHASVVSFLREVAAGAAAPSKRRTRRLSLFSDLAPKGAPIVTRLIAAAALLLLGAAVSGADSQKVTFVGHDQTAKAGTLVTAPNLSILMAHRDGPGMVEVHDKETDTIYVLA